MSQVEETLEHLSLFLSGGGNLDTLLGAVNAQIRKLHRRFTVLLAVEQEGEKGENLHSKLNKLVEWKRIIEKEKKRIENII